MKNQRNLHSPDKSRATKVAFTVQTRVNVKPMKFCGKNVNKKKIGPIEPSSAMI